MAGDMKWVYDKVMSWISAPITQHMAQEQDFTFVTDRATYSQWSVNDLFKGILPWTKKGDENIERGREALLDAYAQRLAVIIQV